MGFLRGVEIELDTPRVIPSGWGADAPLYVRLRALHAQMDAEILGQEPLVRGLLVALLAGGHVLIEGVPGLAKTRAARLLAMRTGLPFRRIPFTPDLLPADVTGTRVFRPNTGTFEVHTGPIFTGILLADEINRAPAKVQSALLEAMQEGQVTIGGETFPLPDPFWVLATQNPIEQEGTYPLPEAQLDRFLFKLIVNYPDLRAERALLDMPRLFGSVVPVPDADAHALLSPEEIRLLRDLVPLVHVSPLLKDYIVALVRGTRDPRIYGIPAPPWLEWGAGPRAVLALHRASMAYALCEGRTYVLPQDIKSLAPDVLRHRVILDFEAQAQGLQPDDLIRRLLDRVPIPAASSDPPR